ncbi:hypothetical protein ACM43_04910 [Bradyrhizobium sp. CCBAU 45321]|uniref:glycosyltransferase n=1 Tax=Bradyrhizobium sp. CCBAU 45321 TaxID=1641878 RepID=UPI002303F1BF|nr:glycosyltransferase [Bradyrhizobium sp. CCBAU 45321]MDA9543903.1 hypothetical protein [Bradyrhizobium sp. CCBAU 45321]
MKFLRLIASCDTRTGGPIAGLLRSSKALAAMGHETHIATLDDPSTDWVKRSEFKTIALGPSQPIYGYNPRLTDWVVSNACNYDVAIIHCIWNYISLGSWKGLRKTGLPYFVFLHGSLDPWHREFYPIKHLFKQAFWLGVEGKVLRDAQKVLFTSEEERRLAKNAFWGYQNYSCEVVAYGASNPSGDPTAQIASFRNFCELTRDEPYLLFLSRIHPKKGIDSLISAFAKHAPAAMQLVIAGPDQVGLQHELMRQAADLGISNRIKWPGMLEGDLKWGAFRGAQAFVLPSHGENFGIVLAEAMACSTPVLTTQKVNIWREIEASGGGIVVAQASDFDDALQAFFQRSPGQIDEMRRQARRCFLDKFEIGQSASDLLRLAAEAVQ